ncbi:MAG: hypothetical protein ABJH04_07285 [Cyclobacteriaceae bacterium]
MMEFEKRLKDSKIIDGENTLVYAAMFDNFDINGNKTHMVRLGVIPKESMSIRQPTEVFVRYNHTVEQENFYLACNKNKLMVLEGLPNKGMQDKGICMVYSLPLN